MQIGQVVNFLATRNQGALLSNTEKNSKEQVKAITLRSGTEIQTSKATIEYEEKKNEGEKEQDDEKVETPKELEVKEENKEKVKPKAPPIQLYEPLVPYPQRLKKREYDQQFAKFLERLKTYKISTWLWWNA